jgi:hypothetical protein
MKSVSCTIWIVAALLVVAALDTLPDPPAVSPNTAISKVIQMHDYSCDIAPQRCETRAIADRVPFSLVAADICKPNRPSNRIVVTGQAADTSPPAR